GRDRTAQVGSEARSRLERLDVERGPDDPPVHDGAAALREQRVAGDLRHDERQHARVDVEPQGVEELDLRLEGSTGHRGPRGAHHPLLSVLTGHDGDVVVARELADADRLGVEAGYGGGGEGGESEGRAGHVHTVLQHRRCHGPGPGRVRTAPLPGAAAPPCWSPAGYARSARRGAAWARAWDRPMVRNRPP